MIADTHNTCPPAPFGSQPKNPAPSRTGFSRGAGFSRRYHPWAMLVLVVGFCCALPLRAAPAPRGEEQALVQAAASLKAHDYARAIELYQRVLASQPENRSALLGEARAYYYSREFKLAVTTYKALLRQDPSNRQALTGLGETYNQLGQYREAEGPLQQALRSSPGDANATWALSRTYFYEHRLGPAQQLLDDAVVAHPDDYRLWESLGEVQLAQRRRTEARTSVQHALDLNAKAPRAHLLLQKLDAHTAPETNLKFAVHTSAYFLHDGVGNQIMNFPQTLSVNYRNLLRSQLTGGYRRVSFKPGSEGGGASEGAGIGPAEGGVGTLAVGIFSLTDSTEFKVNEALTLLGGGGVAQYLNRGMTRSIYHGGLRVSPIPHLQVSYNYEQRIVAPTERAARLGLTARGSTGHLTYDFPQATTLDLSYYQERVSDANSYRGGYGELRRVIVQRPVQLSLGYKLESLSYARLDLFHGYFSPKRFIAHSAVVNLRAQQGRLHYNYDFDLGEETYTRPVVRSLTPFTFVAARRSNPRFVAALRHSYEFSPQWSVQFSGMYFRSALSSNTGAYHAYALLFGLTHRF